MKSTQPRLNLNRATLFGLLALLLTGGIAPAANWTITDLGALGAGTGDNTIAWSINNLGQVVGRGTVLTNESVQARIVVWSNGVQQDLGVNASSSLTSAKINAAGLVAINDGNWKPWLWQTGALTALPLWSGGLYGGIHGINSSGAIVGWSDSTAGGLSVIWQGGAVLPTGLPGGSTAWAVALNDSGVLAVNRAVRGQRSFILAGGSTNYLNVTGLTPDGYTAVQDLNNAGQACGTYNLNLNQTGGAHACLWDGAAETPLSEFPAGGSEAVAMNNLGHVVGSAFRAPYDAPAVLWRDGTMIILNELPEVVAAGWYNLSAFDINDHDQIVGYGGHGGYSRAFLLSPVITPAPFALAIIGSETNVVVSFPTTTGCSYRLQATTSLGTTNWNLVTTISGNGATQAVTDPATNAARFYRVVVP
jgi:uncharacterized membrane protein